ncbi:hypothetical protein GGQ84_001523 [Desulfitispora alkaliphila]|uniref:hypothetical protein n=1 Tax=Desulfitispora alkaliphila TaxID=622674 RepID=UPI003D1F5A68
MKCNTCNETEVIKIYKPEQVEFYCKQGHKWPEKYIDQGGPHQRPENYNIKIEDFLFLKEKAIYEALLKEIDKDREYYYTADPVEKTKSLMKNINADEKEVYNVLKKIEQFKREVL